MILCIIGTRAQLIKMAPLLVEFDRSALPYRIVFTGQHQTTMEQLVAEFGIREPIRHLYEGPEVNGIARMALWLLNMLWRGVVTHRDEFRLCKQERNCVLVHGDTFSTLLGALLGRWHRLDVVHIESGLKSGRWREPFPEELTRRLVFRLSDLAFCSSQWAYDNMADYRVERFNTQANTIIDAVRLALSRQTESNEGAGNSQAYAVVSLHRFENIFRLERLTFIIEQLERAAQRVPLKFVMHPATERQCEKFELIERLRANPNISLYPRMTYLPFVALLGGARCVVTDGGSNQEELSVLGIPTLLMRDATERREGLGRNVQLAHYDETRIEAFFDRALGDAAAAELELPQAKPSAMIADVLRERYSIAL